MFYIICMVECRELEAPHNDLSQQIFFCDECVQIIMRFISVFFYYIFIWNFLYTSLIQYVICNIHIQERFIYHCNILTKDKFHRKRFQQHFYFHLSLMYIQQIFIFCCILLSVLKYKKKKKIEILIDKGDTPQSQRHHVKYSILFSRHFSHLL